MELNVHGCYGNHSTDVLKYHILALLTIGMLPQSATMHNKLTNLHMNNTLTGWYHVTYWHGANVHGCYGNIGDNHATKTQIRAFQKRRLSTLVPWLP